MEISTVKMRIQSVAAMCFLFVGGTYAGSFFDQLISIQRTPLDENLAEDLEPVVSDLTAKLRKRMIKFGQNFIYDENMDQDCLQSYFRILSGLEDLQPWAYRCE